jgi:hypothetical protein
MFDAIDWSFILQVFLISMFVGALTMMYRMHCKVPLGKPFGTHRNVYFRAVATTISIAIIWVPLQMGIHWFIVFLMAFCVNLILQKISDDYIS